MDIRAVCFAVVALLLATSVALPESPKPIHESGSTANRALLKGLWSLTTQPQAITLADLTVKLQIDLHNYKVDGSRGSYELFVLDGDRTRTKTHTPIRSLTLWPVAIIPGVQGNQELGISVADGVCISTNSVAHCANSPVMTEWVPCTDGAACGSERTYFYAVGKDRADKRIAIGSQLRVARECSQGVAVAKTFDKNYWLAICPFSYNKQVRDNVIAVVKEKYPNLYASFDFDQPRIADDGGRH